MTDSANIARYDQVSKSDKPPDILPMQRIAVAAVMQVAMKKVFVRKLGIVCAG